uniref:Uncharacterized protein n=1 Tax=Tetraselmis sp. GSL018 TaxID=582737 RepID=A0A061S8U0_9CHLO
MIQATYASAATQRILPTTSYRFSRIAARLAPSSSFNKILDLRKRPTGISASGDTISKKRRPYQRREGEEGWCSPSWVYVDNDEHERFSVIHIESPDYPGLLRVIAWVMNGLELRVQNAKLSVKESLAINKFWVTNYAGEKLTDKYADICAERISDFAIFCEPSPEAEEPAVFSMGNLSVSNAEHPRYSKLVVKGEPDRQGFFLELVSVLSGLSMTVIEGAVQGCTDCGTPVELSGFEENGAGRLFEFYITTSGGEKLGKQDANALLFALRMLLEPISHGPTVVPHIM